MNPKQIEDSNTKLKPPYGNIAWYRKFFELIRARKFEKFDREIIELNIIKGVNAKIFFNGLRFLGLVDKNGKVTEKFESLRRKGEEFKQNLKKIVEEAYAHLFSKVVISKAKPEHLYNYFAQYYGYGERTAALAIKLFVYLCEEAGIILPEELKKTVKIEKVRTERKKRVKPTLVGKKAGTIEPTVPEGLHKITWGDKIIMFLPKGHRSEREKIASIAKKLIDMYVEEAMNETSS